MPGRTTPARLSIGDFPYWSINGVNSEADERDIDQELAIFEAELR
jgi:hypothetical protein